MIEFTEVRCPRCKSLLFRVKGIAEIEVVCRRCKSKVVWPDLLVLKIISPIEAQEPATEACTGT